MSLEAPMEIDNSNQVTKKEFNKPNVIIDGQIFFTSRRKIATKLFDYLKENQHRPLATLEMKWIVVADTLIIGWFISVLTSSKELQTCWNKSLLTLSILNNEKSQSFLEKFEPGYFLLQVHPSHKSLFITTITTHDLEPNSSLSILGKRKLSVLRNFSIEEAIISSGRVLELLERKRWLHGPLMLCEDNTFQSCPVQMWPLSPLLNPIQPIVKNEKNPEIQSYGTFLNSYFGGFYNPSNPPNNPKPIMPIVKTDFNSLAQNDHSVGDLSIKIDKRLKIEPVLPSNKTVLDASNT
jgi:hypothetical protein